MILRRRAHVLVLACVALASLPGAGQAQAERWGVRGAVARDCAIGYDCGGNDRCNQLRLADRTNAQDIARLSVTCNFAGGGVTLEISSQNGGALRASRDPVPLDYDLSLTGMSGTAFSDRQLTVPLRIPVQIRQPASQQSGLLRVRLYERRELLMADRYLDRIVVTIIPDPS